MVGDIVDMAVGAGGTVLYLWGWGRLQRLLAATAEDPRQRQRRRFLQATFFLLLTPYVLILFWLMDHVGARLDAWLGAASG